MNCASKLKNGNLKLEKFPSDSRLYTQRNDLTKYALTQGFVQFSELKGELIHLSYRPDLGYTISGWRADDKKFFWSTQSLVLARKILKGSKPFTTYPQAPASPNPELKNHGHTNT